MGASQAKSISVNKITQDIVTNVMVKNTNECAIKNNNNQEMTFSNIKAIGCALDFSNIHQKINISQDFSCTQNNQNNQNLQNEIMNKLNNELQSKITGLQIGLSNSETQVYNENILNIKNNIDVNNLSKCIASSIQNQKLNYGKIEIDCTSLPENMKKIQFNNLSQTIISTQVAKCIQGNENVTESINNLQNLIDNKLKSSNEGINVFGIFGIVAIVGIGGVIFYKYATMSTKTKIILVSIIILLFILLLIYFSYFYKKDSFTSDDEYKINKLIQIGKLNNNPTNSQKKLALRIYDKLI